MTAHSARDTLVEDVARVVEGVPGVAFLTAGPDRPAPLGVVQPRTRNPDPAPAARRPPESV
ncbi:hypothetical protein ACN6LA_003265 [Streptomyces sp. SAS_269]|uniref:hypothetical protein n=1 Tax=Streptomyces sp. SAS_269 TaxID=3412749 RepID=UPI00403CA8CB